MNKTLQIQNGKLFEENIFGKEKDKIEKKPKHRKVSEIKLSELDKELYETCKGNDVERVRELIEAGANVNMRGKYGVTPLMVTYNEKIIRLLVEKGADLEAVDNHLGNSVLYRALSESNNDEERIETANDHIAGNSYKYVKTDKYIKKFKLLIELGINLKAKNINGKTILQAAMNQNLYEALKILIQAGVKE